MTDILQGIESLVRIAKDTASLVSDWAVHKEKIRSVKAKRRDYARYYRERRKAEQARQLNQIVQAAGAFLDWFK